jgi:hypothetical protein
MLNFIELLVNRRKITQADRGYSVDKNSRGVQTFSSQASSNTLAVIELCMEL